MFYAEFFSAFVSAWLTRAWQLVQPLEVVCTTPDWWQTASGVHPRCESNGIDYGQFYTNPFAFESLYDIECTETSWIGIISGATSGCRGDLNFHRFFLTCIWLGIFNFVLLLTFECARLAYEWVMWIRDQGPLTHGPQSFILTILMSVCRQPFTDACTLRSLFASAPAVGNRVAANHTHGLAAKNRNDGASFMDMFGLLTGYRPYFIQSSAADKRHARAGCRTFHWAKDLTADYQPFDLRQTDLACYVDVEMYLDMNTLLSQHMGPHLIYTFQPDNVCKSEGEYSYTFDKHSNVSYNVSGGASYTHQVWNYGTDILLTRSTSWYGVHTYVVYNVDRRRAHDDHQLILLTPIRQLKSWLVPLDSWLGHDTLERLDIVETNDDGESFLRMAINTKDGRRVSTGKPGAYCSATIPAAEDSTLASKSRQSSTGMTVHQVKTVTDDDDEESAAILSEYHRSCQGTVADEIWPIEETVLRYQCTKKNYDPEAKASQVPFMTPIVLGCYAPDRCEANDQAAIDGRVTGVKVQDLPLTGVLLMHMQEFASFLVPDEIAGTGHPVSYDEVREKQHRPTQRHILEAASLTSAATVPESIQSFQKSESYSAVKDPRIISTVPGVNKLNYSAYIYAFTHVLRATKWYAFALTPLQVAVRVALICATCLLNVIGTDLSRFDGRVSNLLRFLEQMVMVRYFSPRYHKELAELMASQKNQRARTTFGVRYMTDNTRASGSAETADFNSMDNAFMAYHGLRNTTDAQGQALSPQEAWDKLGIYGGDDGLTPDIDPLIATKACADVGQVLEAEEFLRGAPGVNFLARIYSPEVWFGDETSMCDVARQLVKLGVTRTLSTKVTPQMKACEKAVSFNMTDRNTPIIGLWCETILTAYPEAVPKHLGVGELAGIASYHSYAAESVQYPNVYGEWMLDVVEKQMPGFDHSKFKAWSDSVLVDTSRALKPPLCLEKGPVAKSKIPAVVNGESIPHEAVSKPPSDKGKVKMTPEAFAAYAATRPCRSIAEKITCKFGDKCKYKH